MQSAIAARLVRVGEPLFLVLLQAAGAFALEAWWQPFAPAQAGASALAFAGSVLLGQAALWAPRARRRGQVDPRAAAWQSGWAAAGAACLSVGWLPSAGGLLANPCPASVAAVAHAPSAALIAILQRLLVLLPLLWLGHLLAGSLGLCAGRALLPWRPSFERRLAVRFLLGRNDEAVSRITRVATLGVTLGVWLVLVAIGVLSGFEHDLLQKITGTGGHLTLATANGQWVAEGNALAAAFAAPQPGLEHVVGVAPYLDGPIAVISDINYASGQLLGVDLEQSRTVLPSLATLPPFAPSEEAEGAVVLGSELARNLSVSEGDRVRLLLPSRETLTPLGPVPRTVTARVARLLTTNMYEADAHLVLTSLPDARRFLQAGPAAIGGLQLRLARPELASALAPLVRARAHAALPDVAWHSISYAERNQTLFAALALERVVASVVLAFVILVASFSVVNTLTMAIWQRRFEVAMLKAMGAANGSVLAIFLWQGALVGGLGTAAGTSLGLATLGLLARHGFGIPYEVYYLDALPVHLSLSDVALTVLGSLLVLWCFALLPSQLGAGLRPAEALRDG